MKSVIVVIGSGQIGQAIARRVSVGKHVVLADLHRENAAAAAEVLGSAGYDVSVATVDVSSRNGVHALVENATGRGNVTGVIHAAGVSPSQASPSTILHVDLYGTALVLEEFGSVVGRGRRSRRAPYGSGWWVHHRKRLPHGWRCDRRLLVRRRRRSPPATVSLPNRGFFRRFPPEVSDEDRHELLNAAFTQLRREATCIAQDPIRGDGAHPVSEQALNQLGRERPRVPRLGRFGAHEIRMQGEHHRALGDVGVSGHPFAETQLARNAHPCADHGVQVRERHDVSALARCLAEHREGLRQRREVPAVRRNYEDPPETVPSEASHVIAEYRGEGGLFERDRPGESHVMLGAAHSDCRRDERVTEFRRDTTGELAPVFRVCEKRQVRTVLFHRSAREDDSRAPRIERCTDFRPRHTLELERRVVSHVSPLL
jgi:short subunit dehydrogenase